MGRKFLLRVHLAKSVPVPH